MSYNAVRHPDYDHFLFIYYTGKRIEQPTPSELTIQCTRGFSSSPKADKNNASEHAIWIQYAKYKPNILLYKQQ